MSTVIEAPPKARTRFEPQRAPLVDPEFKLVASMMVGKGEWDRYFGSVLPHLLEFCDAVCLRYESDEASAKLLGWPEDVHVKIVPPNFYDHEGRARQELLDFTLEHEPTHILAIDADEFIADGAMLRASLQSWPLPRVPTGYSICMQEVWNIRPDGGLDLRQDGGWEEHDVPVVWSPGYEGATSLTLPDRKLACGRTPVEMLARGGHVCTAILHFGWTARHERQPRYDRYAIHDGGNYHNIRHLDSILQPDDEIILNEIPFPAALEPWRDTISAHAGVAYPLADVQISPDDQVLLRADLYLHGVGYIRVEHRPEGVIGIREAPINVSAKHDPIPLSRPDGSLP